jgi:hypothetical protein
MSHDIDLTDHLASDDVPLRRVPFAVRHRVRHLQEAEDIRLLPPWLADLAGDLEIGELDELLSRWAALMETVDSLRLLVAAIRQRIASGAAARGD